MNDTAFDNSNDQTKDESNSSSNPIDSLVGEGKKFKSIEDLAKAKLEADKHIERIEGENKGMREDLEKLSTKVENLASLSEQKQTDPKNQAENTTQAVDKNDLSELVAQTYHDIREKEARQSNLKESNDFAISKFGDIEKARQGLKQRASELGLSVEDLKEIGSKSPNAFKDMFKAGGNSSEVSVKSSVNTEADNFGSGDDSTKVGTKAYYDNMRRTNPHKYWSPKVQSEYMAKVANGELKLNN